MSTEKYEVKGTVTVPAFSTEPVTYYNWFKDIQHKDKALHRKSKLIKRLREENAELVRKVEFLEYELLKMVEGNYKTRFVYDDNGILIGAKG